MRGAGAGPRLTLTTGRVLLARGNFWMKKMSKISRIFIILRPARFFLNFERKIAAFLLVWDAETKRLIGCELFIAAVYSIVSTRFDSCNYICIILLLCYRISKELNTVTLLIGLAVIMFLLMQFQTTQTALNFENESKI